MPLAVAVLVLAGCGGGTPEEPGLFDQARQAGEAVQNLRDLGERMGGAAGQPPAEPVDFRRLKAMLPETAAGLPRTGAEGARQGMGEFNVSNAEATYAGDADARLTITISDMGGVQAAMMVGAAWSVMSVDRETDTETERTREIGGFPGHEMYNSASRTGEMQAIVADRFLVAASGQNVTAEQIRSAFETVDLRVLDGMRDEGRPAG